MFRFRAAVRDRSRVGTVLAFAMVSDIKDCAQLGVDAKRHRTVLSHVLAGLNPVGGFERDGVVSDSLNASATFKRA